jgi:hypothetical protein
MKPQQSDVHQTDVNKFLFFPCPIIISMCTQQQKNNSFDLFFLCMCVAFDRWRRIQPFTTYLSIHHFASFQGTGAPSIPSTPAVTVSKKPGLSTVPKVLVLKRTKLSKFPVSPSTPLPGKNTVGAFTNVPSRKGICCDGGNMG